MTETKPGEMLEVPEMRAMWRRVLDGMCADGCDPIDASEAMLAEALRAKLQIDGPERVAAVMEAYVAHLRKNAREISAAIASKRPVAH